MAGKKPKEESDLGTHENDLKLPFQRLQTGTGHAPHARPPVGAERGCDGAQRTHRATEISVSSFSDEACWPWHRGYSVSNVAAHIRSSKERNED